MKKSLENILFVLPDSPAISGADLSVEVAGIEYDSRQVYAGSLFVALSGKNFDGHQFIPAAISSGASAIIGTQSFLLWQDLSVPYIQVEDARHALARISASFYDFPARKMVVIGVTGTDGKTTTSNFIYQILRANGINAGMISTVNAQIGDVVLDTGFHVTTPEAPSIQRYLHHMVEAGITHVVLETTSHGLAQERVTGCEYDIGVVTNITHEHFDYHGGYEGYLASKARLFEMVSKTLPKNGAEIRLSILNKDDQSYKFLNAMIETRKVSYSLRSDADLWAENIQQNNDGSSFFACSENFRVPVETTLPGDFNIANCLAAFSATVFGLGIDPHIAAAGIKSLSYVPGRMEKIELGQSFQAIVDFAHTPNALEKALETARPMTTGKVIAVFGSAGLRDRQKRRMMASVSARLADITILTAEDPRTENLNTILAEMETEALNNGSSKGKTLFIVADRGAAIQMAVDLASENDLVITCGKGHEQSMCFGEIEYPWDDRIALRAALSNRLGLEGPEMPFLPTQE